MLNELGQTKSRDVHSYTTINAVAATVSPGEEARLAADPAVAEVVPDQLIQLAAPETATIPSAAGAGPSKTYSAAGCLRGCSANLSSGSSTGKGRTR